MLIIFGIATYCFLKKKIKHWVCQILFLAACRSQIECPLFAEYHYSASSFDLYHMCVFSYSHINSHFKQLNFFDSINVATY